MVVEIVSVGTELLMGQVVNSDARFIAAHIAPLGCQVYYHTTVGDNPTRLTEVVHRAVSRSDVVIFTGGLGPTDDDLTKETVASALGQTCVINEALLAELEAQFRARGREMAPNNIKQVAFPENATILPNPNGTAPGCIMESGGKVAILLPGPPRELEPMVMASVLPYLERRCGFRLYSRELRFFGIGESDLTYRLRHIIENQTNPTIAPYVKPGQVTLRITAKCADEAEGERLVAPMIREIASIVGDKLYSTEGESLAEFCAKRLRAAGKTIAVAESLTGGLLADAFVSLPGSSAIFMEGVIAYQDAVKIRALGVNPAVIQTKSAVSADCAILMADGMRKRAQTDYALATTGFAGPTGGKVGLVYVALANDRGVKVRELNLYGNRDRIRLMATLHALDLLRREL